MGAGNGGPVMEVNKAAGRSLRMTAGDIIILTGVSGVGKSTLAARLAADLKAPFIEGDDHHLPASIAKMAQGIALVDADRWPWLEAVAAAANAAAAGGGVVIACSALKRIYRDHLAEGCLTPPIFIHLHEYYSTSMIAYATLPVPFVRALSILRWLNLHLVIRY